MSLYFLKNTQSIWNHVESLPGNAFHIYKTHQNKMSEKGTPRCICLSAMFTLEAAVVLPMAACFLVSILYFFRIMQVQMEVQKALDDTGRQIAVYAAGTENKEAISLALAKIMLGNELKDSPVVQDYVRGGITGISLITSELEGTDICLNAVYQIRFPIRLLGRLQMTVKQNADCRKWDGWPGTDSDSGGETWVYIAENGSVYHTIRNCTYIRLSVREVSRADVMNLRNQSGARYHECELCRNWEKSKQVYITSQGECYHYDMNCSGIKRTVFKIRLSEIGNRRKCGKCENESGT